MKSNAETLKKDKIKKKTLYIGFFDNITMKEDKMPKLEKIENKIKLELIF